MSVWADLEATGGSYESGTDPFFTREVVRELGAGYLAGADPHHPYAAPTHEHVGSTGSHRDAESTLRLDGIAARGQL